MRPPAIPRPCSAALATFGVPARKWSTRADLIVLLEPARRFLDSAPQNATISQAAQCANLSFHHFAHRFRDAFGVSPARYHRQQLMKRARDLLPRHSVGEVSIQLGYADVASFIRAYRRHWGQTPGALRMSISS